MPNSTSISGRTVTFLRLHSVTHIAGAGQLPTNVALDDNRYINFSMVKIHGGVLLKGDGARGMGGSAGSNGEPFEVFIPDAACQSVQLKCEE